MLSIQIYHYYYLYAILPLTLMKDTWHAKNQMIQPKVQNYVSLYKLNPYPPGPVPDVLLHLPTVYSVLGLTAHRIDIQS